ncbi:Ppx/GppA phosphatase [Annulohypoxylon maeteangense]|uniref:Ppx/GppA phosphatase n=1 Tax=Annulohypoxylon maeteangense TaxID=1927788 RepID=UPI002008C0CB|nr:Ppx/GppA phosphatase [Annulohypoxylon maeteangense]KAI0880387.1 Ppx/GppA phosphatase [Annulohypoxylon maeteangense]
MSPSMDIIQLENFASKMPQWSPNLPNHLYALVDIGSNGIRFSISDLSPPQTRLLRCLYRERVGISLFDALNASPSSGPLTFPHDVINQVSKILAQFKSVADDFGVPAEHISVFATEAMRKADNAASMLDAILATSGLGVHVLAPEVETLFGAMGARSGFSTVNGLLLDLGGGSVQMTYLNSSADGYEMAAARTGRSLPFGAAKLIKILEDNETDAQVTALSALQGGMRDAFAELQQRFPSLRDTQIDRDDGGVEIYLCGGGFRGYGSILMHTDPIQPYPIHAIGTYTVQGSIFRRTQHMCKVNDEYNGKIFGMSKRRRQQFPAIAAVVEALIEAVPQIRTVTFCSGGNREGALFMKLPKAMREENPLSILHPISSTLGLGIVHSVLDILQSSLPADVDISNIPTVFTLGLGPLFVENIWMRVGEPRDANAAFELHHAIHRDSSAPGLSHLARAVLGLTLCSRWKASLSPSDKLLQRNLQKLVDQSNPEANFWAEYLGAIANLLAKLCPAIPKAAEKVRKVVKFSSTMENGKSKNKLRLIVSISSVVYQSLDQHELEAYFKDIGKHRGGSNKTSTKVELTLQIIDS